MCRVWLLVPFALFVLSSFNLCYLFSLTAASQRFLEVCSRPEKPAEGGEGHGPLLREGLFLYVTVCPGYLGVGSWLPDSAESGCC